MARPKPKILAEYIDKTTYKAEQILEADAIWAVFYKGKPFNLRTAISLYDDPAPKYKRSSFGNKGHAINLAKKLNEMFNCKDFEVYSLTSGKILQ